MIVCPNCGEENPERARFCLACGTALEAAPSGEERKVVSVLFVDLVGFTAGADRADPEDVRAMLRPYHARVSREIERFGGTVEKFVGDAVMAVFGAPVAYEDDPERAVRAGLRILDAIGELNEREDLELSVRAAVATGEAVVQLGAQAGTGEGIATGDVVNTAARLQGQAPIGGLIVNEHAYRATRQAIRYEELPALELKGKGDPVPAWQALSARSRFGVDAEAAPPTPFVGRDRELRLLQDTFERMVGESEIQLVTITGEPGVGKTRLLTEFRAWVDDRRELVYWRQGRCLPYGDGITFWALGEIVKAHAGILESDAPDDASSKLDQAVAEADDAEWLHARLGPLVGLAGGGETDREESYRAWQRFIESIAARGPLVLLFEDLHWADDSLLEFVERLVDWSSGLPILVLCTGRPELYESHPAWGGGKRNSTTVALSPLSQEETARLVSALLDAAVLPAETQAALLDRAGGNPLYAEEYARLFLELGSAEDLPLPDTVQGLIAARLDTLPADRKALLQDAAVVGKVFWAGVLEAMGDRDADDVRNGLHQLVRKELLRSARLSSVEGQAEYVFWHALIRDVAYGQIPRSARAAKHIAVADWIEAMAGTRLVDHSELLAHHTTEAIALGRASGATDPELELRAARYLQLAGDRAFELDVTAADARYRKALELLPAGSEEHGLALLKLAEASQALGRFEEANDHAQAAAQELEGVEAMRSAAIAWGLVTNTYFQLGGADRMRAALERCLGLLEPLPPGPELVEAYARMVSVETLSGKSAEVGLEWAQKAVELGERLGARRELVRAYQWRGLMRCELGDLSGIEDLERGLAEAIDLRQALIMPAYVNLADQVWRQRGPAAALEIQTTAIEFGRRRGGKPTWPMAESCWTLHDLGRWDELLETAEEVRRVEEQHGAAQPGAMAQAYAALVHVRRGNVAVAEAVAEDALSRARVIEDPQVLGPALAVSALLEEARGNTSAALNHVNEFREVTRDRGWFRAQNVTDAARVACAGGNVDLAGNLLDNVVTAAEWDRLAALTARATIAAARGEPASELYAEAVDGWQALGCVFEHALALEAIGEHEAAGEIFARLGIPDADQTAARTAK